MILRDRSWFHHKVKNHLTKVSEKKKTRPTFIVLTVAIANIPKKDALSLLVFQIGGTNIKHAEKRKEADLTLKNPMTEKNEADHKNI